MKRKIRDRLFVAKTGGLILLLCLTGAVMAQAVDLQAICVPWEPAQQQIPHFTYSGATTTVKGIARGEATEYRWAFGDGGSTPWALIVDPYNLSETHVYNGVVGQLFLATLFVKDALDNVVQDTYPVMIHESSDLGNPMHEQVRINMAIDEGLWYLHTHMIRADYGPGSPGYDQPYGYWNDPGGYPLGAAGTAVDAFQLHGSRIHLNYDTDPYTETIQRGMNYILTHTYAFDIGVQPAGDPDSNGNGIGLVANHSSNLQDSRQTYLGGICMVALASSGAPGRVAYVGGDHVYFRTYKEIVQDMVDFFAWGQVEAASPWAGDGGWRYYANYSGSDMSTTQWPALGINAAENPKGMDCTVPQWVKDELEDYLDAMQITDLNNDHGGFRYSNSATYLNCTKAGAGIICHHFIGTAENDPRVEAAIGFLYRHWNDNGTGYDYTQLHGNSYGMYAVMKGFRIPDPDILMVTEYDYNAAMQTANMFDWFYTPTGQANQGLATYIVGNQQVDGSWDDIVGSNKVYDAFCTGWRVLTLLKGVDILVPVAVICDCDKQEYNLNQDVHLDGSCSYHQDPLRTIVLYEWDLDDDGTFETVGPQATIPGGFPDTGFHTVLLRVTDDRLDDPQTSTTSCDVFVHPPPHCPHADAGGPYLGWPNVPIAFDGSGSWDPDNEIVLYEWDLDNDGLFGAEDLDCFGQASDALGINPQWTWTNNYFGVIGLRVTDEGGEWDPCSDTDYTTVEVGNHPPVPDHGGPYTAYAGHSVMLDGRGSYDPDPGDYIASYAWDLDNDGQFDDCFLPTCDFPVGDVPGKQFDVGLEVKDSLDVSATAHTTVTVLEAPPAVFFSPRTYLSLNEPQIFAVNDRDMAGIDVLTGEAWLSFLGNIYNIHTLNAADIVPVNRPAEGFEVALIFSVREDQSLTNGDGTIFYAKSHDVVRLDPVMNDFEVIFDGIFHQVPGVDAVSQLDDGRLVISPSGEWYCDVGCSPPLYFNDEDLAVYNPADGSIEIFFRGGKIGIHSLDGVDVVGNMIYFSVREPDYLIQPGGQSILLEDGDVGLYDPGSGLVTRFLMGDPHYIYNMDALSVGVNPGSTFFKKAENRRLKSSPDDLQIK